MAPVTGATVVAQLPPGRGATVVRDGAATIVAVDPDEVRTANSDDAFALLSRASHDGFWIGALSYDLGRSIEHVSARAVDDLHLPDVVLARYRARLVLRPGEVPAVVGDGEAADLLARAAWRARRAHARPATRVTAAWASSLDRAQHRDAV